MFVRGLGAGGRVDDIAKVAVVPIDVTSVGGEGIDIICFHPNKETEMRCN